MIKKIFSQPKLGSPSVAWCRVLLPDVGPFSTHPLNPRQHYLLQALDVSLHVEFEAELEDKWWHNVTTASDHPKHLEVDKVLGFNQYECESLLRLTSKHSEIFVLELPVWIDSNPVYCHQIFGGVNYVIVLLSSQTVSNWLKFAAQYTKSETKHMQEINYLKGLQFTNCTLYTQVGWIIAGKSTFLYFKCLWNIIIYY